MSHAPGVYGANLIVNGNAELVTVNGRTVTKAAGSYFTPTPPPDWTVTGSLTEVRYGSESDVPGPHSPGPAARGNNFFYGGQGGLVTSAKQTVDVSLAALGVDAGTVQFTLSAYLGGYARQDDNAKLAATFLDSSGKVLGKAIQIGPVLAVERQSTTGLVPKSTMGQVPPRTRSIVVTLTMTQFSGGYDHGCADNLSLVLTAPPLPPAATPGRTPVPGATVVPGGTTCTTLASATVFTMAPSSKAVVPVGVPVGFAWQPVQCAGFYYLQIWLQKAAANQSVGPNSVSLTAVRVKETSYSLATTKWLKGTYTWRIIAADAHGSAMGTWSTAKTFTLI
jgi:hypothetical protein